MHTQTAAASSLEEEQVVHESEGQCFNPWPQQSTLGSVPGKDIKPEMVLMCLGCVSLRVNANFRIKAKTFFPRPNHNPSCQF